MLQLYREKYFDFNVRHFQKLTEEHGVRISYTWVEATLQGAGLVTKQRRRGMHRRHRPRRPGGGEPMDCYKPDISLANKTGQLDVLPTGNVATGPCRDSVQGEAAVEVPTLIRCSRYS